MSKIYPLVISKVERETLDSVLISFNVPEEINEKFKFEAGQYLNLETNINENKVRRSYSICSAPGDGLQVGIKEVPRGLFSTYANREIDLNLSGRQLDFGIDYVTKLDNDLIHGFKHTLSKDFNHIDSSALNNTVTFTAKIDF